MNNSLKYFFNASLLVFSVMLSGYIIKPTPVLTFIPDKNAGDTNAFAPNTAGGWGIFSSYLNQDTRDSVRLEIILKRTGRIDGKTDQQIGSITNPAFIPVKNQKWTTTYYVTMSGKFRITKDGECYLKQDRGTALRPSSLPGIDAIPINIRYKIN